MEKFSKFYKKSYDERLKMVSSFADFNKEQLRLINENFSDVSEELIENYLTDYGLPEGIATNFKINQKDYLIPMVIEEPSVIAAASNGAQLLKANGGIDAHAKSRVLTGQVILKVDDHEEFVRWFEGHKKELKSLAVTSHPSIEKHGGVVDLKTEKINSDYISLELFVDVGDAMGANTINTMLEAIATSIENNLGKNVLMSILSNYGDENIVTAKGSVPFSKLEHNGVTGKEVAERISQASLIAQEYSKRAATHNKGIMNGIDAVVLATGNDWRAVESSANSFASRDGKYRGLSKWKVENDQLVGKIELPIPSGIVGGATHILPMSKINYQILKVDSALEFMEVLASVGLAQNLAALKALVTDGIQRGHMNLQLRSLALTAGAEAKNVNRIVEQLKSLPTEKQNLENAKSLIKKDRN